jgi:transcriptional regulator with XRE-family HTH domain
MFPHGTILSVFDPQKLRTAREAKGLNPSQLAIQAGLARNVVHRLEDGSRGESVRTTTLAALARVLDVTVDDLLSDEPAKVASVATPKEDAPADSAPEQNPEAWRWG